MATLTIHDTIRIAREVEIPDACPHCKASFLEGHNLHEWDYVDVQFHGDLQRHSDDDTVTYGVAYEHDRGDNFHPVAFYCGACERYVHEATERNLSSEDLSRSLGAVLAET